MMTKEQIHKELDYILSKEDPAKGNPRVKEVVNRLLKDLFYPMVDLHHFRRNVARCRLPERSWPKQRMGLALRRFGYRKIYRRDERTCGRRSRFER